MAGACKVSGMSRSAWYRPPQDRVARDWAVIDGIDGYRDAHPRRGFWKCFKRLRKLGYPRNHKRVHRVYCDMGINQPR